MSEIVALIVGLIAGIGIGVHLCAIITHFLDKADGIDEEEDEK